MSTPAQATVITPWKGSGTLRDPYRPQLCDDHPVQWSGQGAPSDAAIKAGNATGTITIACTAATLTAIQADPNYQGKVNVISQGAG